MAQQSLRLAGTVSVRVKEAPSNGSEFPELLGALISSFGQRFGLGMMQAKRGEWAWT